MFDMGVIAMKEYFGEFQSWSITGTSPSDCLMSYPSHSLGGWGFSYHLCRDTVGVFYSLYKTYFLILQDDIDYHLGREWQTRSTIWIFM